MDPENFDCKSVFYEVYRTGVQATQGKQRSRRTATRRWLVESETSGADKRERRKMQVLSEWGSCVSAADRGG